MKIIKSLINGVAFIVLFALIQSLTKDNTFVQALARPDIYLGAACTAVGSFIGYTLKENRTYSK